MVHPENIHDDIIYISVTETKDGFVDELKFIKISETVPEARLKKLLERRNFDEAETFGTLYDMDLALVRKVRAQVIIDGFASTPEDLDLLIGLLDDIGDVGFTLESCLNVYEYCVSLGDVMKVLKFGNTSVMNSNVSIVSCIGVTLTHCVL